jgi:hypothetical protein
MCVEERKRKPVASSYVMLACASLWLTPGNAQQPTRDLPPNAHYSAGEQGWACNKGFSQVAGSCMADGDDVPSASAFEVFDEGQWRCRPGYHRAGKYCVPATAPAHASYVAGGERWECNWGFQKIAAECREIKPPPHGYIDASGHDWVCYPGFDRISDRCVLAKATPHEGPAPRY